MLAASYWLALKHGFRAEVTGRGREHVAEMKGVFFFYIRCVCFIEEKDEDGSCRDFISYS
jgi:hypothetical protein